MKPTLVCAATVCALIAPVLAGCGAGGQNGPGGNRAVVVAQPGTGTATPPNTPSNPNQGSDPEPGNPPASNPGHDPDGGAPPSGSGGSGPSTGQPGTGTSSGPDDNPGTAPPGGSTTSPPASATKAPWNLVPTAGTVAWTVQVDGYSVVYIAPETLSAAAPLLIMLPYQNGQPADMANLARAGRLAADYGVFIVLPSIPGRNQWQDNNPIVPQSTRSTDIGYLNDVIDNALGTQPVDPAQLYMVGYSNSGFMAERYACQSGRPLAGLAMVASTQRASTQATCAPPKPLREIAFNGTSDWVVPYKGIAGGKGFQNFTLYGAQETEAQWQTRNGCDPQATTSTSLPRKVRDGTRITLSENTHCTAASAVALYTITGGGHTWPGNGYTVNSLYLGPTTHNLDATLALWAFFSGS